MTDLEKEMLAALQAYLAAQPQCECTAPECPMEAARILTRAVIAKAPKQP